MMLNLGRCCNHNYSGFIDVLFYQFYCSLTFECTRVGLFNLRGETPQRVGVPEVIPIEYNQDIAYENDLLEQFNLKAFRDSGSE